MTDFTWIIVSTIISAIFSLATFYALKVTNELQNLQGFLCRCYLASYTALMIVLTTCGLVYQFFDQLRSWYLWTTLILGSLYFLSAITFWLNVMSFDIWITFRKVPSRPGADANEVDDLRIVRYSIFVWGSSLVHLLMTITHISARPVHSSIVLVALIPIAGTTICSICLLMSTALMIKQRKREAAMNGRRLDKLYQENIQWFVRCSQLLFMMTSTLILLAIVVFAEIFFLSAPLLGPLQSIFTFAKFLSTYEVRRSLKRKFFHRHSTPMIV